MTTIEDRLLRDLPRIAATIETHPRLWKTSSRVNRRGRRALIGGLAVLAVAGGGIVLANALIPDDLHWSYDSVDEFGGCGIVSRGQSRLVATTERANGDRLELWIAPTSSGGEADALRYVNATDGLANGLAGGCHFVRDESWVSTSTEVVKSESTGIIEIYGHTTHAVPSVIVTYASGATVTVEVQIDGYFLTSFRDETTKYETLATVAPAP